MSTSWNPRGANVAKHARLQLVIDRRSLSSDLKFWYVSQIETFWQGRIVARYLQFRVLNSLLPPYLFLPNDQFE
jgi:hypothetical protein